MRVLVVDDDKLVAVSLKTILEADGEITVVGLGEAGVGGSPAGDAALAAVVAEGLSPYRGSRPPPAPPYGAAAP